MKNNQSVRDAARIANVPLYAVAHEIGVSEPTLFRWLRFQLPADKERVLMDAIKKLEKEAV